MPDTQLAGQPGATVDETLQQILADHPGLANPAQAGGKLNDYHPAVQPDDPSAQQFLGSFVPQQGGQPALEQQVSQRPAPTELAPQPPASPISGGLIFGKYKSIEEAERGYREADQRRQTVERENTALKAVNLHLEQVFAPVRQQREVPTPPQEVAVQFRGDQPVVPTADFVRVAQEQARAAAREEVRNALEPLGRMNEAQTRLIAEFPDFSQRQSEFAQWLAANPTYKERVTSDPDAGLEHAYLRFNHEAGAYRQQTTQQARGQVETARQAASATSSSPGSTVRRTTDLDNRAARLNELYNHAQQTGDWGPYKKARLEEALGSQFMSTLDQSQWGR
jgi:hypothetical protein